MELSARFPSFQHRGFYFPPAAGWSPFLSRTGNVLHAFLCYIDRLEVCGWWADKERFYKKGHRVTSVCFPVFKHRGIHYPTKFAGLPPERETFCMLPLISFRILTQKRPGRIGTKTRNRLRELHSLTVSKSVRFLYSEGAAGTLNCP